MPSEWSAPSPYRLCLIDRCMWRQWRWTWTHDRYMTGTGSIFVDDLSQVLQLAGLPALFIGLIGPALLQLASGRACMRALQTKQTRYSWHFSHDAYVYFVLLFSVGAAVVVVIQITASLSATTKH